MTKQEQNGQPPQDFQTLLIGSYRLLPLPDGSYRVLLHKFAEEPYVHFTQDALRLVDPRIPDVLSTMYSTEYNVRRTVPTEWLRHTLSYLDNPVPLTDVFTQVYPVKAISSISWLKNEKDSVTISVVHYDYIRLEPTPLMTGTNETYITVALSELDKHYPGWLVRYHVLHELDADSKTLKPEVFARLISMAPAPKETLSDLTFD